MVGMGEKGLAKAGSGALRAPLADKGDDETRRWVEGGIEWNERGAGQAFMPVVSWRPQGATPSAPPQCRATIRREGNSKDPTGQLFARATWRTPGAW